MSCLIKENVNLKPYATMALPAIARYFVQVNSLDDLSVALQFAQENKLRIIVLGEGSNSLFITDVNALVLQMKLTGLELEQSADSNTVSLISAAGENWDGVVQYAIANNCYGIENLSWIPGAAGAAPIQNIGAYGVELSQVLDWVEVIELNDCSQPFTIKRMGAEACQLSYRESIFKQGLKDQVIITRICLKLSTQKQFTLQYGALNAVLDKSEKELSLQDVRDAVIAVRMSKLPDPEELPNSGSFFKNPIIRKTEFEKLYAVHPELPSYPVDDQHCKIPAAWLIDHAGWKGYREGSVGVHNKQALVLINYGHALGDDIVALANSIQEDVLSKYGVQLEPEPRMYL